MKKTIISFALAAMAFTGAVAQTPVYLNEEAPLEERVQDALKRLTLEEKVALLHAQGKFSSAGVKRLGIPELWMSDGPHGVRAEISWNSWKYADWLNDSITAFPALTCLAATWNPQMSELYGNALAEEALYREKDVMLGPGVNIYRTPLNGRNFEYMGEDPLLASVMCVPYIKAMQKNGVAVCVKHYALNNQEKWRDHIDVYLSDRALHEIYLPAFKAAVIEGGAWSIMGSYNKIRGEHGCNNAMLLNDILKDDWKFDGAVITDWGGCHYTYESAMNGLDLEMGTHTDGLTKESQFTFDDYYLAKPYLKMLREGKVPMEVLDGQAERVLRLIFRTAMNRKKPFGSIATEEHYAVCREVGNEGTVLLKNDAVEKGGEKLLPIDASKYKKILVVGDNAVRMLNKGGGSSELKPKDYVSPLAALRGMYGSKVDFAQAYKAGKPMYSNVEKIPAAVQQQLHDEAVEKAKTADLVIFIGGLNKNHKQDCEAADRESLSLPYNQDGIIEDILKVNKNVIVYLLSGNAVAMPWIDDVPAIVQGWYYGSMGGLTVTDILSGAVNPSGKLPFSFPAKLEDCGAHAFDALCYPGDSIRQEYKEDILVGYRWHDTKKIAPLFPFGHGLSYTTFNYGKPALSSKILTVNSESQTQNSKLKTPNSKLVASLSVTIPITNSGTVGGKEVVQLYVGDVKSSVARPIKELKHFAKIALKPGETKEVSFDITVDDLKFYDDQQKVWRAEPGKFKLYIGSSSRDIRQEVTFELK